MKKLLLATITLSAIFAINCNAISASQQNSTTSQKKAEVNLDKVAAIVNDDIITESELNKKLAIAKKQIAGENMQMPIESELRRQVLESIIDMDLQIQIAKRAGVKVSDDDLQAAINNIEKSNNLSHEEFVAVLNKDNINYDDFKNQIREQMLASKVSQQFLSKDLVITKEEISDFINNNPDKYKYSDAETAKKEAQDEIYRKKLIDGMKAWIKELRSSSYIKIIDN